MFAQPWKLAEYYKMYNLPLFKWFILIVHNGDNNDDKFSPLSMKIYMCQFILFFARNGTLTDYSSGDVKMDPGFELYGI